MLIIQTGYNGKTKTVELLHEWDIDKSQVVDPVTCAHADKGKFIRFNDGSGWYTRLKGASDMAIKTEAGTFRRADFVICSKVKWVGGFYSGVPSQEEHPLVRPYTRRDKEFSTKFINGTLSKRNHLTPRMRMLVLDKLRTACIDAGVDETFIASRFLKWASGDGIHAFKSNLVLARICGIELEQNVQSKTPNIGKFMQVININQERRSEALGDGEVHAPYSIDSAEPDREMVGVPTVAQLKARVHGNTDAE